MTQKLIQLQEAIREICTELVHPSEHEGDTGYYRQIELQHILRAMPERSFNMAHIKHGVLLFEYYSNEEDSFVFVGFHLGEDLSAPENAPFVEWAHSIICKG